MTCKFNEIGNIFNRIQPYFVCRLGKKFASIVFIHQITKRTTRIPIQLSASLVGLRNLKKKVIYLHVTSLRKITTASNIIVCRKIFMTYMKQQQAKGNSSSHTLFSYHQENFTTAGNSINFSLWSTTDSFLLGIFLSISIYRSFSNYSIKIYHYMYD